MLRRPTGTPGEKLAVYVICETDSCAASEMPDVPLQAVQRWHLQICKGRQGDMQGGQKKEVLENSVVLASCAHWEYV